jgi:hypothetical protein
VSPINTFFLLKKNTYEACLDAFVKEDGNGKKNFPLIWGVYENIKQGKYGFFL